LLDLIVNNGINGVTFYNILLLFYKYIIMIYYPESFSIILD